MSLGVIGWRRVEGRGACRVAKDETSKLQVLCCDMNVYARQL
jgi:hypothetical protein